MIVLDTPKPKLISYDELPNEMLAEIVEMSINPQYIGKVVMRFNDTLFLIGMQDRWIKPIFKDVKFRILSKGTKLEL